MIRACVINSDTGYCENIINLDDDGIFVPYKQGIEIAPDNSGEIGWIWNGSNWIEPQPNPPTLEEKTSRIRSKRDGQLRRNIDIINGPRWSAMTPEKQSEWMSYRQALLDVPQQEGFPDNVIWPVKPE
jgi:hypothetical protein